MSDDPELPSVDGVARLDAYLDELGREQRPTVPGRDDSETQQQMLAAQLRMSREGVEAPRPEFLRALEAQVGRAVDAESRRRRRPALSRGRFLRTAATLAGGAGLGVAGVEGAAAMQEIGRPHELVVAGNERWYAIARAGELAPGGVKSFSAGGVLGFLINTDGHLRAVSAICTHMGCRLKPHAQSGEPVELRCLCHDSRFNGRGEVTRGLAPSSLPSIRLHEEHGIIYALGTKESV